MWQSSFITAIGTGIALKKAFDEKDSSCSFSVAIPSSADVISFTSGITRAIKAKDNEITNLNARNEALKKYKTELDKTKVIVSDIASQIAVIANIWQTVRSYTGSRRRRLTSYY